MAAKKSTKEGKKRLVLLDTHAILHRAYHAIPDFATASGEPTGGLYGLCTMLFKIVEVLKPDYIVAAYDLPKKTFRHVAYDAYKVGRQATDESLKIQIGKSRELLEDFGVPVYSAEGFEADDVLGTITEKLKKDKNIEIIIATGDMDTLQLVDEKRVQVFTLKKGITDTILYDEKEVMERYGFGPEHITDYKGLRGDPSDNIPGVHGIGEKTATILIKEFGTVENIYKVLKKNPEKVKAAGVTDRLVGVLLENEEEALFSKTLATISKTAPINFDLLKKSWKDGVDTKRLTEVFTNLEFRSLIPRISKVFGESAAVHAPDENVDDADVERAAIKLWLINSDITNGTLTDILSFTKTQTLAVADKKLDEMLEKENLTKVYEEIELPIFDIVRNMKTHGILIDKKVFADLSKDYHKKVKAIEKKIWELAGEEFNIASPKQLGEILFNKLDLKRKSKTAKVSTKAEVLEELHDAHPIVPLIGEFREYSKLLSTYIDVIPGLAGEDGRLHARFIQHGTTTGRFASEDPNLQNIPIRTDAGREIRKALIAGEGKSLLSLDYSQIELRIMAILSKDKTLIDIFKRGSDVHAGVAAKVFGVEEDKVEREMRRRAKIINFGIMYGMGVSALQKNLGSTRQEAMDFHDAYFKNFPQVQEFLEATKAFAAKHYFTETLFGRKRRFPALRSHIPFLRSFAERMAMNAPLQGTQSDIVKLAIRYANEDLKDAGLSDKISLILQIHDELVYEVDNAVLDEAEQIIKKSMETALERSYIHYKSPVPILVSSGKGKTLYDIK